MLSLLLLQIVLTLLDMLERWAQTSDKCEECNMQTNCADIFLFDAFKPTRAERQSSADARRLHYFA